MSIDPGDWRTAATDDLLDTILALPDRAAAERFFRDLCTFRELHDLAQRWHVVRLLDVGRPYAEISRTTRREHGDDHPHRPVAAPRHGRLPRGPRAVRTPRRAGAPRIRERQHEPGSGQPGHVQRHR